MGKAFSIRGTQYTPIIAEPSMLWTVPPPPADTFSFPKKLAIVTHTRHSNALTTLGDYMEAKEQQGWEVMLVTEEQWNPENKLGQNAADALRVWLAANYQTEGLGYVLLLGSPHPQLGLVPMKYLWPLKNLCQVADESYCSMQQVPSDYYYADLEGEWDLDQDGYAGEYPDDTGTGGVDLGPEVIVGRIPVYYNSHADFLLGQVMAYEQQQDFTGRNRVLLAGAMVNLAGLGSDVNEDSANSLTVIGDHLASLDSDLVFTRMFEQEGLATSTHATDYALSQQHLINAFNYGHGLSIWYAHGYPTYTERMLWVSDDNNNQTCDWDEYKSTPMLSAFETGAIQYDSTSTFTWQISCYNGYPELDYNMATMLLLGTAVGAIAPTRSAFGEDNRNQWLPQPAVAQAETMALYWADRMQHGYTNGHALAYVKYAIPSDGWDELYPPGMLGYSLMALGYHGKFNFNLYGDPTLVWQREAGTHADDWPWVDEEEPTAPEPTCSKSEDKEASPEQSSLGCHSLSTKPGCWMLLLLVGFGWYRSTRYARRLERY